MGANLKHDYERDGYVMARRVIDPGLVAEARQHVHWLIARHPELRPEQFHAHLAKDDPFWVRLVSDERLLDIAQQFVGPDIALFATHYICKPPKTGQPVLWHQDGSYWPLEPMEVVTLWLAVTDSTPQNGCMRVIPRSHGHELSALQERKDVPSVLGSSIDPALVDASQAVDITLAAGDVSIHHPNLIHGSEANTSDQWRMGLTIRYIPTSTKILKDIGCPFLLRGREMPGVNAYLPRPVYREGVHMRFRGCEKWT